MRKRIAIFCDGTWNGADQAKEDVPCPTNVVRLALRVAKRGDGVRQIAYYGQGVGTGSSLDKITGGAFGHGLDDNLYAAYRFLMLNYEPGDEIFLFGFSRGAYTARSLAGMIRKCGLLQLRWARHYRAAVSLYCDRQRPGDPNPTRFRCDYSAMRDQPTPIEFIGVWDTVGALGIPVRGLRRMTAHKYQFHDVELSGSVRNACHALAIDERRAPFQDARWCYKPKQDQKIAQVWFCGVHSDIGGGYAKDEPSLSDITLGWMRDQAHACGLRMDAEVETALPLKPDPLATLHNSKTGLYRLTPGVGRQIGTMVDATNSADQAAKIDPTQSLHPSVLHRWDVDQNYRPDNLRTYFKRIDDTRHMQNL